MRFTTLFQCKIQLYIHAIKVLTLGAKCSSHHPVINSRRINLRCLTCCKSSPRTCLDSFWFNMENNLQWIQTCLRPLIPHIDCWEETTLKSLLGVAFKDAWTSNNWLLAATHILLISSASGKSDGYNQQRQTQALCNGKWKNGHF